MKRASLFLVLAACSSTPDATGINDGPPTTVHLTVTDAPGLVAVKDGTQAAWQPATQVSPTSYEAVVHGPYVATVVCKISDPATDPPVVWVTWQRARVPEDPTDLAFRCGSSTAGPARYAVHGHVAQASWVVVGDVAGNVAADSDFTFQVPAGTYDLYALTSDRIAVRRGITVGGATEVPALDVAAEGTALVELPLATDQVDRARVEVSLASAPGTFAVAVTQETDLPGSTKIAPASVVGSREAQRVSLTTGDGRSVSGPFVPGDTAELRLPEPLVARWPEEPLAGQWTSVEDQETLELAVRSASFARPTSYYLEMTPGFRAATDATRIELDVAIPGFQTVWQTDPLAAQFRVLTASQTVDGVTSTRRASSLD